MEGDQTNWHARIIHSGHLPTNNAQSATSDEAQHQLTSKSVRGKLPLVQPAVSRS
jgi:hypothetical protein